MSKYLDETVRLQSEIRQEWIREVRGERLQGIAEGVSSAPHLASSSAASFPGPIVVQKNRRREKTVPARSARELEIKGKMEERTGWRGQNESQIVGEEKKSGRLYGAAETSKERAEWHRLQRKNLSILGLLNGKEWPQCHRESSWQERRSHLCQKEKEQGRLSKATGSCGGRESRLTRAAPWREGGDQSESMERKGWTPRWRMADSKKEREDKQEEPL